MSLKTTDRCKKKLKKFNISSTNGRKRFSDVYITGCYLFLFTHILILSSSSLLSWFCVE